MIDDGTCVTILAQTYILLRFQNPYQDNLMRIDCGTVDENWQCRIRKTRQRITCQSLWVVEADLSSKRYIRCADRDSRAQTKATWVSASSPSSLSLILGPTEQCNQVVAFKASWILLILSKVARCWRSSSVVNQENNRVPSVSNRPEWISLSRRSFSCGLASRIYQNDH